MRKIIIDCDPGIDDSLALMLALSSPELDIMGITTVSGNVPADMGARNARKVLKHMGRMDIPVYIGEQVPLKCPYTDAMDTHGQDGMGESFLPEVPGGFPKKSAVEFLEETLEKEKISIIALGPMTNLAKIFSMRPKLIEQVEELVSMAGISEAMETVLRWRNITTGATRTPPPSVTIFSEGREKIEMVGLDVTRKIVLTPIFWNTSAVLIGERRIYPQDHRILYGFSLGIRKDHRLRNQ